MKLIIAEKPSQARDYAKALGGFSQKDGYLQSAEYYITWCYGHLVELERDDKYRTAGPWSKQYLPIIPQKYLYKIGSAGKKTDPGKKKQVETISSLMARSSEIINATDADREGELIFRYVYNYLNCKLPFKRLWISSLTEGDIRKGFQNLLPGSAMDNLGKSAYARAIADWLVGINGTQASTLQFGKGTMLTIGRVQTAILKIICERYLRNKNFQKSFTYRLRASHKLNVSFFSETDSFDRKEEAQKMLSTFSRQHVCRDVAKSRTKQAPPLLFSIDTLIIESNRRFGYSGQQTLDTAQSLYEKKLTSYPRTDSTYINEENFENIKRFLPGLAKRMLGKDFSFSINPKSVNDKKLTGSHDAIVPTGQTDGVEKLSEQELNIYRLVILRLLQSFSEPAEYEKQKITFDNNGTTFLSYASKLVYPGWKTYDTATPAEEGKESEDEQNADIQVQPGQLVDVLQFDIREIESKPPPLYSEVNLTQDLTNFGKLLREENPELLKTIRDNIDIDSLQIGTQATRPGIIELLKKRGFITLSKNKFIPTETGLSYYAVIRDLQVSNVVTTALWEMKLKKVAEGAEDISAFYKEIKSFTEQIVSDIFSRSGEVEISRPQALGKCPKCGKGQVMERPKNFGCTEWKQGCDFTVWKELAGKKLTAANVAALLSKGETGEVKGFTSKAGKKFAAKLRLTKDFKVEFLFNN